MSKQGPKGQQEIIKTSIGRVPLDNNREMPRLKLNKLVCKENPTSPKTPGGSPFPDLPSPVGASYEALSDRSKIQCKAELHGITLPDGWSDNRTLELAKRQLNVTFYYNMHTNQNSPSKDSKYAIENRENKNEIRPKK